MSRARRPLSALLALPLLACGDADAPSNLQQRAQAPTEKADAAAQTKAAPTPEAGAQSDKSKDLAASLTANPDAPEGAEKLTLALALPDDTTYVVQTVGNVQLPLLGAPIAFAREERMALSGCSGEGSARRCKVRHHVSNFEAEGQAGSFLRNDEDRVKDVVSTLELGADGAQVGVPSFDGPPEKLSSEDVIALSTAHFFQCIRFPAEAVAVGAKWRSDCARRMAGVVATREVLWEVAAIQDGDGGEKLAELRYVGKYDEPDRATGGTRRGTVQGAFYFRATSGEPHILREQISVTLDPTKGLKTVTSVNYTFGKVLNSGKPGKKGNKETLVLTNGEPFPAPVNKPTPADAKDGAGAP